MSTPHDLSPPQRLRRAALAMLVLALPAAAGMASAQPAAAAFPGANGRILFIDRGGDLSTINPDGSGLEVLRTSDGDGGPSFSPDGSRIVFTNANDQLLVMSANGGKPVAIASGAQMPCWSPDGTKVAFASDNGGIATVNADGSGFTQVTMGGDTDPAWSPDGSTIVFARWDPATSNHTLWAVPAAGGSETQLTATSSDDLLPDWSPDGSRIAFQRASAGTGQIVVMNADGSGATAITDTGSNLQPVWSPNGRRIAFISSRAKGLWLMGPDGSNQTHVDGTPGMAPYDWQAARVTATASHATITYGRTVTITVHLSGFAATENHTVGLTAAPVGGTTKTIGTATVNANGNAAFTAHPGRLTTYTASWSGDAEHPGGGISQTTVSVRAAVATTLAGFYATTGRRHNHLYHYNSSCPTRGSHCPRVVAAVAPNKAGQRVTFTLEMRRSGHWRDVLDFRAKLGSRSRVGEILVYGSSAIIGIPVRIRVSYAGDTLNAKSHGKWAYFEVTR